VGFPPWEIGLTGWVFHPGTNVGFPPWGNVFSGEDFRHRYLAETGTGFLFLVHRAAAAIEITQHRLHIFRRDVLRSQPLAS
jgi:hypothetical protein